MFNKNNQDRFKYLLDSVAQIGGDIDVNPDFSKRNLTNKDDLDTKSTVVEISPKAKPTTPKESKQARPRISSKATRSKRVNKTSIQKTFRTTTFRKSNKTVKIMDGLIKVIHQVDPRINAKEVVSELLIKWVVKEYPDSENPIMELLEKHIKS